MSPTPNRIVIVTAPSGAGKTSITRHLLHQIPALGFSVSATTRQPRGKEVDGRDYHFIGTDEFRNRIREGAFLEWEMVYEGKYYGTLMSEIEEIWLEDRIPLLDIDVKGALRVMGDARVRTLSLFIQPPSLDELERRLRSRGTDSEDSIRDRLAKAEYEMSHRDRFDRIVINDQLDKACTEAESMVRAFLDS
ncbi:MAG: guanylate kinase [Chitinophagia bacterium]|nr:guanylate kinase [Chitinophagia bacterium]